jgi:hypothetical protein
MEMKICSRCGIEKELGEFGKAKACPSGYLAMCRVCRRASRRMSKADKATQKRQDTKLRARGVFFIDGYKSNPCMDCGNSFPTECMDFDHVRGEKLAAIATMPRRNPEKIWIEIQKCELVCSNCHRIRTHKRLYERRGQVRSTSKGR